MHKKNAKSKTNLDDAKKEFEIENVKRMMVQGGGAFDAANMVVNQVIKQLEDKLRSDWAESIKRPYGIVTSIDYCKQAVMLKKYTGDRNYIRVSEDEL